MFLKVSFPEDDRAYSDVEILMNGIMINFSKFVQLLNMNMNKRKFSQGVSSVITQESSLDMKESFESTQESNQI